MNTYAAVTIYNVDMARTQRTIISSTARAALAPWPAACYVTFSSFA